MVDLCLRPVFPALFDLLISPGQSGLVILLIKSGPTNCPKLVALRVHSTKSLQKSGLKSLNIEKETFSLKNDIFLSYKSQSAYL